CRRWWNAKLLRRLQDEGIALAPVRAESERDQANRILTPMPWKIACEIIDADSRLRDLRAVVESQGKNGGGRPPPQINTIRLFAFALYLSEIVGQQGVETRCLRRKKRDKRVMCGLTDSRIHGGCALRRGDAGVAVITAEQSIHGIENRDVHNSHCTARAPRSELFAEH